MTTNKDLQATYDAQYAAGYAAAHTPVDTWEESLFIHKLGGDWRGKRVLEIGCGEGRLAALIAASGADVWALDYSEEAIRLAKSRYTLPTLEFDVRDDRPLTCSADIIMMQGVLEHQDFWRSCLSSLVQEHLAPGGHIITSSPSFLNPRGYIWQALRLLLGVPMSKTDLHTINPWDIQGWCDEHHLPLYYESCHHDWAAGELLLTDYAVRLPKALADAGLPTDGVPRLLEWLAQSKEFYERTNY